MPEAAETTLAVDPSEGEAADGSAAEPANLSLSEDATPGTARVALSTAEDRRWRRFAIACLCLLTVVNGALAVLGFRSLTALERRAEESLSRSERRGQALDAQIDLDSRRRQLALGLRDAILAANEALDWNTAYRYAALAVAAGEKYPRADPALIVALGIAASGYRERAESASGARGLYQIFPSTARLLSRALGWDYSEDLLFDPARSTELAALYLETLFAVHGEREPVLTEFREGAPSAFHRSETATFVAQVKAIRARLVSEYGTLPSE